MKKRISLAFDVQTHFDAPIHTDLLSALSCSFPHLTCYVHFISKQQKAAEVPLKAPKAPRNSGLKAAAAAGTSAEVEALQKQIDALQSQLNKIKK